METKVSITNGDMVIKGNLNHVSDNVLAILCHGFDSDKEFSTLVRISRLLAKKGISSFRFDFSVRAESTNPMDISLIRQADDIRTLIGHFERYRKIILIGHSLGIVPAYIGADGQKVDGIVSLNGFFDGIIHNKNFARIYAMLKRIRFFIPRINREYTFFRKGFRPESNRIPMLMIATPNDEALDYRQSKRWFEKLPYPKEYIELSLSGHGMVGKTDAEKVVGKTVAWMQSLSHNGK